MAHKSIVATLGLAMLCAGFIPPSVAAKPDKTVDATVDADKKYQELDDNSRYLLIMGSIDGFSSAPAGPCFPDKDNQTLDQDLIKDGFGDADPATLPGALTNLGGTAVQCAEKKQRSYSVSLLKSMPDTHLSTYLSAAVRAYASVASCPVELQPVAAAHAAAAIFSAEDATQPVDVISPSLQAGCTPAAS